jgi:glucuronate isomerase
VDNLEYHRAIREDKSFPVKVLPAFRPDKALNIHLDGFREYVGALGKASGIDITNIPALKEALV